MKISDRIQNITGGGADGWGVFYKSRQMVASGVNVTELTIGEHDIRTNSRILDAMNAAAQAGHTGYAMVPGIASLREKVAQRIAAQTGVPTKPSNILVTAGGQAALFATHHVTCDPGDTALFIDPYYATYPGTIRGAGAIPKAIMTSPDTAFQPTRSALEKAAPGAVSLLINSPNNPTGVVYSAQTLQDIAKVCTEHDLWLISDEVYDTQVWDGQHISPRSLPGMTERTLVIGSMSKSHAMTGSRIGWVCGPEEVIEHLITLATHTTYGVPGYIQDAAQFALNQGPDLEHQIAAPFQRRRELTLQMLARQNVVKAIPAQGAMYVMLDIRATGLSGEAFALELLETHKIAVMPGESFGNAAQGHLRVAMTVDDDAYVKAFETLLAFAGQKAQEHAA